MWDEIIRRWTEEQKTTLVLPGNLARDSFLHSLGRETVWDFDRVKTLGELWRNLARQLEGLPREIFPAELEPQLARLVGDLPNLQALLETTTGLDMLGQHLEVIDRQADLDYQPCNETEEEIAELRDRMLGSGAVTSSALRSAIARRTKEITLPGPLMFSPLPEPSRQLGGLLKGLGRQNRIDLYLLGSEELCRLTLQEAGMLEETELVGKPAGWVNSLWAPGTSSHAKASWYRSDDRLAAAVQLAGDFVGDGLETSEVAIVSADDISEDLAREATLQGLPILIREAVTTRETAVGSTLLLLADLRLDDPYACRRAALETGLGDEDFQLLRRSKGQGEKLRALLDLGARIVRYHHQPGSPLSYDLGRSQAWLDGLRNVVGSLEASGTEPWNISTIISGIRSPRLPRGERSGVKVLSPAEVSSYRLSALVFVGLDAGSYPPGRSGSPFVSEQLLRVCPALRPRDLRPEFASVLASAEQVALLRSATVRGQEKISSPFYLESTRAFQGEETLVPLKGGRYRARTEAARRQVKSREIERALEQAQRERIPENLGGSRPSDYSVTELETYLRCPYGWFVQSVLRPRTPGGAAATEGSIIHGVMEELLGGAYPDHLDRIEALPEVVERLADGRLPERDLPLIEGRLQRLLERYSGPTWPFEETMVEVPLRMAYDRNGDELVIRGRADRIDLMVDPDSGQRQLLVIDYKSNQPPRPALRLQPFLYPRMAAETLEAGIIGFTYLSVRSGRASAHLLQQVGVLEERGGPGWGRGEVRALRSVREAVEKIEAGHWSEAGRNCPVWCPHRHLSETGASG